MEANDVLLGLLLTESGIVVGAHGKEKLRESMGRLGLTLTKSDGSNLATPTAAAPPMPARVAHITIAITFALPGA